MVPDDVAGTHAYVAHTMNLALLQVHIHRFEQLPHIDTLLATLFQRYAAHQYPATAQIARTSRTAHVVSLTYNK